MARIRQIKPEFYLNEDLARCPRDARLMFPGLWMLADRAGRLEDRPARIKVQIFPYDDDIKAETINDLLGILEAHEFILRYAVAGKCYIQIQTFHKHQHCHVKEPASQIPAPDEHQSSTVLAPDEHQSSTGQEPGKNRVQQITLTTEVAESPVLAPGVHRSRPSASGIRLLEDGCGEGERERLAPVGDNLRLKPEKPMAPPAPSNPPVFEITEQLKTWAREIGLDVDLEAELRKFQVYCQANGKRYANWQAAFENWLLKAPGFNRSVGSRSPPRESVAEHNRRAAAEAEKLMAARRSAQ